jgi:NADH dehydrogenase
LSVVALAGWRQPKALKRSPARVVLIDRTNHRLFQPLLYQVATSVLTPGQIGSPIRGILRNQPNTSVFLGDVTGVSPEEKCVLVNGVDRENVRINYDYLILATSASHNYFGVTITSGAVNLRALSENSTEGAFYAAFLTC